MKIGYARVSTIDQNPNAQRDALKLAGCEKIVTEKVSGASLKRPKLEKLLHSLDAGDVLTVWRLDRVRAVIASSSRCRGRPEGAKSWFSIAQ